MESSLEYVFRKCRLPCLLAVELEGTWAEAAGKLSDMSRNED